jgi:hypothetical protein
MIKKAFRAAATLAALAILVCLAMPVASQASTVRDRNADVRGGEQVAPAGLWQSLADLWQGLVSAVFAGSEGEGGEDEAGEDLSGAPPGGGENTNTTDDGGEGDSGPGADPNG